MLSGRAMAEVDGGQYELGAGDFIAFPTKVAHHLRNPFDEELVYLMGGKRMVKLDGQVTIYDLASGKPLGPLEG